jgi:uncharacterized protein involved in exopolysaccharide biosynthesis
LDQDFHDEFGLDERGSLSKLQETILFGAARYWMLILIFVIGGTAIGLYLGASKPNIYLSSAKLLFKPGGRELFTEESLAGVTPQREQRQWMEDEIHMLTDRAVFRSVVEEIGPTDLLEPSDPKRYDDEHTALPVRWMHELQAYLIRAEDIEGDLVDLNEEEQILFATEVLIQDTVVFPNTGSNVISVLHSSTSPEKAQYVTAKLVRAFIDRHKDQFSLDRYLPDYEESVKEARTRYLAASTDLDKYVEEKGISDLELEISSGTESLADLKELLTTTQADLKGKQRELAVQEQIDSANLSADVLAEFEGRKVQLEGEVAGMVEQVEELDRSIKILQARQIELASYKPALRQLTDALDAARTDYDTKRARFNEFSALAKIDLEGDTNLTVLQEPTYPIEKEGPKRLKLLILGFAAGLALGGLVAVLRQAFETNLRYPSTVQRWSGLQLLAVIPESPDVRRLQRVRHFI